MATENVRVQKADGRQSLLRVTVLGLAWLAGFCSRLFAVIRFESIIHEFDPWYVSTVINWQFHNQYVFVDQTPFFRFNYRATHYMVKHGFYNFLNWFDERAWYPLGRIVGGTVRFNVSC